MKYKHKDAIEYLTRIKAFRFDDYDGIASLLHIAATANAVSLVETILESGQGYDTLNHIGWDFLIFAAAAASADVLRVVFPIVSKEKFNIKDNNKRNLYHIAAINDHFNVITTLFSLGLTNYNEQDKFGKTPLHYAAMFGYTVISEFLSKHCEKEEKDVLGMTPLHYAAKEGHHEVVNALLKSGKFDINATDNKGKSVVYVACEGGSCTTVQLLVNKGADINICPVDGTSLATVAVMKENMPLLKYLSTIEDYNMTQPDKKEWTPVHYAAQLGYVDMLDFFKDKYPESILKANNKGRAPLSVAAAWGVISSLAFFVSVDGTDYNIPDNDGNTPLHLSIMNGHDSFSKALLKTKEADVNAQNNNSETPLMLAIQGWSIEVISELINTGECNLNLTDKKNRTALMYAVIEGQTNVVQYLINQPNIDCKLVDSGGWGPQHFAAVLNTCDVTRVLVESDKFNFNFITRKGKLPIDLARTENAVENVKYLNKVFQYDQPKRRNPQRQPTTLFNFIKPAPKVSTPAPQASPVFEEEEADDIEDKKNNEYSDNYDSDYEEESHDIVEDFLEAEEKAKNISIHETIGNEGEEEEEEDI